MEGTANLEIQLLGSKSPALLASIPEAAAHGHVALLRIFHYNYFFTLIITLSLFVCKTHALKKKIKNRSTQRILWQANQKGGEGENALVLQDKEHAVGMSSSGTASGLL